MTTEPGICLESMTTCTAQKVIENNVGSQRTYRV